jgi:hypothetical protein
MEERARVGAPKMKDDSGVLLVGTFPGGRFRRYIRETPSVLDGVV